MTDAPLVELQLPLPVEHQPLADDALKAAVVLVVVYVLCTLAGQPACLSRVGPELIVCALVGLAAHHLVAHKVFGIRLVGRKPSTWDALTAFRRWLKDRL